MNEKVIGYWFAAEPKLPHGDGRQVVIGESLSVEPPIILCQNALHGSIEPFDALSYATGNLIYKCEFSGVVVQDDDKLGAQTRKHLAIIDAAALLHEFVRKQALSVAHLWPMPSVVRQYLETGDENFRAAAYAATRSAALTAACTAVPAAAAAAAAAYSAAYAGGYAAAHTAAYDAAYAAARAADYAGAYAAARAADYAGAYAAARAAARAADRAAAYAATRATAAAARTMFNDMVAQAFVQQPS